MFKIVKGAVEGKRGKEAIIETMSKRIGRAPEHVQKVLIIITIVRSFKMKVLVTYRWMI